MANISHSHSTTETKPYVPTDAEDMLDVAISVLDPRLAHEASSSQSTPRTAGRYRQVHLSFASPPPDSRKRARSVPPPPTAEELEAQDKAIAEDAEFAPNTKSPFGGAGVGARDFQKSACRNHDQSKVHLAAMEAERLAAGTEWIAQNDAPIALYPMLVRFMAEQGCPDMMNGESYGRYYSRYAFGEFVEAMTEHLVAKQLFDIKESAWYSLAFDESTDRARESISSSLYDTIVKCLWAKDMSMDKLVGVSTDGASVMTGAKNGVVALLRKRCPWLVAIHCVAHREALAAKDAPKSFKEFNVVDQMIQVKNHVDKVKTKLSQYYVEPGASNGPNTSRLNKFLAAHGSKDKRKLELKGVDENGKPAKAEIVLHEDIIDPENPGGDATWRPAWTWRGVSMVLRQVYPPGVNDFLVAARITSHDDDSTWLSGSAARRQCSFNHNKRRTTDSGAICLQQDLLARGGGDGGDQGSRAHSCLGPAMPLGRAAHPCPRTDHLRMSPTPSPHFSQ
ncbi:unnamed protein product [Closterium sp. Yama58-4]|nr:unnamed protein product [Closterium sp. Yama58-4]